jgi:hypothetical protein
MFGTEGPEVPQPAGPCATRLKMPCHWVSDGLVPLTASMPQSALLVVLLSV